MENQNYYVPILKWKRGEQIALENLSQASKSRIIPLIEIPPIDYDWVNNTPKKTIDAHIADFCSQVSNHWGTNKFFLDLCWIEGDGLLSNGKHPIDHIITEATTYNLNIAPVVGLDRSQGYIQSISNLIQDGKVNELCIRVETDDFTGINQSLTALLNKLNINSTQCHLIIDLKEISSNNLSLYQVIIPMFLSNLLNLNSWMSIALCGTGFPINLSSISKNSHAQIPRTEFTLWQNLNSSNSLPITIQYGDYCIANPELSDVDPRVMNMSGNIRYTTDNSFLVYKGVNTRNNGFAQMQPMCKQVVDSSHYCGPTFSWGDDYINNCALGNASTGNAETWRRVGTNHHIEFIVDQLSNLSYF